MSRLERHVPPWVMASQEGGDFNAFPDLPPADAPADLPSAAGGGSPGQRERRRAAPARLQRGARPGHRRRPGDRSARSGHACSRTTRRRWPATRRRPRERLPRRAHVLALPKHFPGLGAAISRRPRTGPSTVGLTLAELRDRDLVPFRAAFDAGAPAVVLSHALYTTDDFTTPGVALDARSPPTSCASELRFRGVAITDDLADPPITASRARSPTPRSRRCTPGADMLCISGPRGDQQAAYVAVLRAVRRGEVPRARLDEAVLRILQRQAPLRADPLELARACGGRGRPCPA